jgi:cytochrome c556
MKFVTKTLVAAFALVATVAVAKEGVQDPTVKARMDLMGTIGMNTGVLGNMASGKAPFDAAAAAAAREALIAASADIEAKFATQADDPVSEGTPQIWTNFADFTAKGQALGAAATAMDVASLETVQAGMGAIGGTCRDCHTTYRAKR